MQRVILFVLVPAICVHAQLLNAIAQQISPADVFRQAHNRLTNVAPVQNKAYALALLLKKASEMTQLSELSQWSDEAFELSEQMPLGSYRVSVQEMAISVMSRQDPDRALAMLNRLDPIALDTLTFFNIGHGLAAAGVFESMLGRYGPSVTPKLIDTADALAAKGLYPYLALERLMVRSTSDDATKIFQQAVAAYGRSHPSVTNEFEFVSFLKRVQPRLPTSAAMAAVPAIVARIQRFVDSGATCNSTLRLYTDKGMIVLDCGERVIYEALPTLQKMDAGVAAKLKTSPVFEQIEGAKVNSFMPMGNPLTQTAASQRVQTDFDVGMMLHNISKEDPDKAAQMASTLSDGPQRLNNIVLAATEMATKNPAKARELLNGVLNELGKVDNLALRLTVTSNCARTAFTLGDRALMEEAMKTVFALAHDYAMSLRDGPPEQRQLYASNGYRAMLVTQLGASVKPEFTLGLIPTLDDDEGEAYLLMIFAEAMLRPMPIR